MSSRIKNSFFSIIFFVFIFLISKHYFSEQNIIFTNQSRSSYKTSLEYNSNDLPILRNDTNNILVSDEFQRVLTKDDFYDKIGEVKKDRKYFEKVQNDFLNRLPSEDEYYKEFEGVLNKCLNG